MNSLCLTFREVKISLIFCCLQGSLLITAWKIQNCHCSGWWRSKSISFARRHLVVFRTKTPASDLPVFIPSLRYSHAGCISPEVPEQFRQKLWTTCGVCYRVVCLSPHSRSAEGWCMFCNDGALVIWDELLSADNKWASICKQMSNDREKR